MMTLIYPALVFVVLVLLAGCGHGPRLTGLPSWFDIEPYMTVSKKRRGKLQQKRGRR
jgi:hypothetical protein